MAELLPTLITPAFFTVIVAAGVLVLVIDWRLSFVALAAEYAGVAVLMSQVILPDVAGVKALVGVLVSGILALTGWRLNWGRAEAEEDERPRLRFEVPTGFVFRLMAATMVLTVAAYLAFETQLVLPGLNEFRLVNAASLVLMGLGLLNLGLTEEPINAGMGLLTLLNGFELFYTAVEQSLAIVALLAAVQFGVALAVAYLATVQHLPAEEAA